jgi:hypothetical protein
MKIDEILAEMPNLRPEELEAIEAKSHELYKLAIIRRLESPDAKPWPPQDDPEWDAFMARIESRPPDNLPVDLAANFDRYQNFTLKRP